jgi:hypothetical protein
MPASEVDRVLADVAFGDRASLVVTNFQRPLYLSPTVPGPSGVLER